MTNPYSVYTKNMENVTTKEDLLLKVYEKILSHLNIAKFAIEEEDIKTKAESIAKVTDAIAVLKTSLDMENGKEIAENLDKIYDFCLEELLRANLENNKERINNVIEIITPIYDGFKEAVKNLRTQNE